MSEIFHCQGPLNGREIPEAWSSWDPIQRATWIDENLEEVECRLDAYQVLKDAGEWPAAPELPDSESAAAAEPDPNTLRRLDRRAPVRRRSPKRKTVSSAGSSSGSSYGDFWWQD